MMKGNDMICKKCKKVIRYGRGWAHVVKGDEDYHLDCYLNYEIDGLELHDLSVAQENTN